MKPRTLIALAVALAAVVAVRRWRPWRGLAADTAGADDHPAAASRLTHEQTAKVASLLRH